MEDPGLFTLPCRLGDSKPFDTLADLGSCVNIIPLYLFKKLNIGLLEETDHIFGLADGTKSYLIGIVKDVEVHIGKLKILNDFYVIDMKKDPETPLLGGRRFLATANAVIDCRKAKIAVGEGITRSVIIYEKKLGKVLRTKKFMDDSLEEDLTGISIWKALEEIHVTLLIEEETDKTRPTPTSLRLSFSAAEDGSQIIRYAVTIHPPTGSQGTHDGVQLA
ncbi:MAK10-like protein [Tanacetum coccineum]|uniref:MAK10-like protein n=1 Tax=Tanacetum coccineum TaxID=301880 RepID=A0ABQ5BZE5_9ASTR